MCRKSKIQGIVFSEERLSTNNWRKALTNEILMGILQMFHDHNKYSLRHSETCLYIKCCFDQCVVNLKSKEWCFLKRDYQPIIGEKL